MQVPETIQSYADVLDVTTQLQPLEKTYERAARFELPRLQVDAIRLELSAYLLGMMVGDASKAGGSQNRYASMNLDLQLTKKQPTNEKLGDFVCMCQRARHHHGEKAGQRTIRFHTIQQATFGCVSMDFGTFTDSSLDVLGRTWTAVGRVDQRQPIAHELDLQHARTISHTVRSRPC
ncbi:MAG: hypothetical protein LYZ66_03330 [Nitrososphaerales archaeon]|nr:hypothetical protein [Nitrososphaerales archaeon]